MLFLFYIFFFLQKLGGIKRSGGGHGTLSLYTLGWKESNAAEDLGAKNGTWL